MSYLEQTNVEEHLADRGENTSNGGWTALHLASYFGQIGVAEELCKAGVEVNAQTDLGDTPLHLASVSGKKEVALLLLRHGARATVLNLAAQTPRDITEDDEIITMLEAAERREERKMEERLLGAAKEGDSSTMSQLLSKSKPTNIHCKDSEGNTPLHIAACRGHTQCVDQLLKSGASPFAKNKHGQCALHFAKDDEIRFLVEKSQEKGTGSTGRRLEGVLWKKSNFQDWISCWVVVENGNLSWFATQSDAACVDRQLGCKSLLKAQCVVGAWDEHLFTIKWPDNSAHHFKVSSRCSDPECSRRMWLDAVEVQSSRGAPSGRAEETRPGEGEEGRAAREDTTLGDLSLCLQSWLEEALDLRDEALEMRASFFTNISEAAENYHRQLDSQVAVFVSMSQRDCDMAGPMGLKAKEISELCSETSSVLRHCLDLLASREEVWSVKLEQEVQKNKILSEAVQSLATEQQRLKRALAGDRKSPTASALTDDDFHDALCGE